MNFHSSTLVSSSFIVSLSSLVCLMLLLKTGEGTHMSIAMHAYAIFPERFIGPAIKLAADE